MRRHLALYTTATRYNLVEHGRNRFAMLLVVLFVPAWITLVYCNIPDKPVPFRLDATGEKLAPAGNLLTQITGAINAVTLITGFMMFAATFSGGRFDRRLGRLCGVDGELCRPVGGLEQLSPAWVNGARVDLVALADLLDEGGVYAEALQHLGERLVLLQPACF